jgi:hypothetical protein
MRFFRVHFYDGADGSAGYQFFTVQAEAARAARAFNRDATDSHAVVEVEAIEIEPTKAGILDALNTYASHANNG